METALLAELATIVGAVSILLTLVFVVIELRNNAAQALGNPTGSCSENGSSRPVGCRHCP